MAVIYYVDDILLCAETREECDQVTQDLFNYLAECGYRVFQSKAQISQQMLST